MRTAWLTSVAMLAERRWRPGALRYLIPIFVLAAVAAGAGASGSATGDDLVSDVQTTFTSHISPSGLPAGRDSAPVRLALSERVQSLAGAHSPPLRELNLDLDRHLGLSVEGLPRCGPLLHESPTREEALAQCEEAKVGSGTLWVEVAFPEQVPVQISGQVNAYNFGVHDGRTMFLLYAYLPAPVTGVIPGQLKIRRRAQGVFGWEGKLTMPKIANGAGSVTYLSLRFDKGIFSASCPTGRLWSHADTLFMNGEGAAASSVQPCRGAASKG